MLLVLVLAVVLSLSDLLLALECTFPNSELLALHDFYNALDGESWHWSKDTVSLGFPWDFIAVAGNPCTDHWQGIDCGYLEDAFSIQSASNRLNLSLTNSTECYVYQMNLNEFGLQGQIPPSSIANLTYLQTLQLANNRISGAIDSYLWNLSHLESFVVDNNLFSGSFPTNIDSVAKSLSILSLTNNLLEGTLSDSLCNLLKLTVFAISGQSLFGTLPACMGSLTEIDTFFLNNTSIAGSIPIGICSWPYIRDFTVTSNAFNDGLFPTCFGETGSLQYINISYALVNGPLWSAICENHGLVSFTALHCGLTGQLPVSCFHALNMPNFTSLNLGFNNLNGTIPDEYWTDIEYVYLKKNHLNGSIPTTIQRQEGSALLLLREITVDKNKLTGTIPNWLAYTNISLFSVIDNKLTGTFPDYLCPWTTLQNFQIQQNFFYGTIPACVIDWTSLQIFNVNANQLTGKILEDGICSAWKNIKRLDFSHNYFTGTLPHCYGHAFLNMTDFSVEYNYLHGTLPDAYCLWHNLHTFYAHLNYQFIGTIPACYGNWTHIIRFMVDENNLNGSLSNSFCNWKEINLMGINDNFLTGSLPDCFGNFTKFSEFYALNNQLTGTLSRGVCNWDMQFLQLYENQFSGSLPDCIRWNLLQEIYIWGNQFTGPIDSHWCDKPIMQTFDIRNNRMTGTFPACMWKLPLLHLLVMEQNQFTGPFFLSEEISCGNHSEEYYSNGLRYITASDNHFTGSLPSCLGDLFPSLQSLGVGANNLQGSLPDSICKLANLYDLQTFASHLTGTFPDCWSEQQRNMEQISVSDNLFHGTLPASVCNLQNLVSLLIGNNDFSGSIPACYGHNSMQHMNYFNISFNQLTGELSDTLCGMNKETIFFAANNNALKGKIPICFGSFQKLQFLYLSANQLTGSLAFLRFEQGAPLLVELFIADNMLTGPIFLDLANKSVNGGLKRSLTQIIAQHNSFSGFLPSQAWQDSLNISLSDAFGSLRVVDIAQNKIEGKVDSTLFQIASSLNSVILIKNCFSGELSADICLDGQSQLQVLALDGLSAGCSSHELTQHKVMYGTIPACLFTLPYLQTFHAAGNQFGGSIPDVDLMSSNLSDLSLSHNVLRGTVPASMQRESWINLDLAFNKLGGMLINSGNKTRWAVAGHSIKLNRNRLSGNVPTQYLSAKDINMLNGNLFSCKASLNNHDLPENDANTDNYSCGTVSLNLMLILGGGLAVLVLGILTWLYCTFSHTISSLPQLAEKELQVDERHQLTVVNRQEQVSLSSIVYDQGKNDEEEGDVNGNDAYNSKCEESGTSSEIRREEDVESVSEKVAVEHKADDPAHPANQLTKVLNQFNNMRRLQESNHHVIMQDLAEQLKGAVAVLYSDIRVLFKVQSESTITASTGLSQWAHAAPNDHLTLFLQVSDQQRRMLMIVLLLSLCVLMPSYFALSWFYKTHSSSYSWIVSAAYIGGVLPAVMLLIVWILLFLWLYRSLDPNNRLRASGTVTVLMRKTVQRLYQLYAFWQEYSIIAAALLANAVLLLVINGVFVYLVIHNGRAVSISLQIALVMFKLVYNRFFVSSVIRGSEWLQRLRKRQHLLKKGLLAAALQQYEEDHNEGTMPAAADINARTVESLINDNETLSSEGGDGGLIPGIYSEAALVIFNLVIVPIIATLCVDSNCFSELLVPPPPLQTPLTVTSLTPSYRFAVQNQLAAFSSSLLPVQTVVETQFSPPFAYSGQCASSVIATYEPVFVLLYLTFLFFLPLVKFIYRMTFSRPSNQQAWASSIKSKKQYTIMQRVWWPTSKNILRRPEVLCVIDFDRRSFVVSRVTNIAVLMTFGWVFPPLAALITIVEIRDAVYLVAALRRYISKVGRIVAAEKELGIHFKGVAASLPYLQLRYLPLGAICLGLLLLDIAADEVGLISASWAPLLMTIGLWFIDHVLLMQSRQVLGKQQQRDGGVYVLYGHQTDEEEEIVTSAAYTPT